MLSLCQLFVCVCLSSLCAASDPESHLKPFGWGKSIPLPEIDYVPTPKKFFEDYVLPNKPVVLRGANKQWPGFTNWQSDAYFVEKAPAKPFIVSLDVKRGTPDTPSDYVDFKEFLQKYNSSSRRMVEHTPPFLMPDVLLPSCLTCDTIAQGEVLMGHKMWYGANYTTSVVHKDAADNINCLVYGKKKYTVLAPEYGPKVVLDRPDGLFSTMEVDSVDAYKYPGLDDVEYQISELRGGDCVFIPYKWIHQVRSYGRNIAVNIWWNHWRNKEIDLEKCTQTPEKLPIANAKFHGWGDFETRDEGVKEHTIDLLSMAHVIKPITYPRWVGLFSSANFAEDVSPMELLKLIDADIKQALKEAFTIIDTDGDKRITPTEFTNLPADQLEQAVMKVKFVLRESRVRSQEYEDEDKADVAKRRTLPKRKRPDQVEKKPVEKPIVHDEM